MMINASRFLGLFKRTHIAIPLKPERPGLFKTPIIFSSEVFYCWGFLDLCRPLVNHHFPYITTHILRVIHGDTSFLRHTHMSNGKIPPSLVLHSSLFRACLRSPLRSTVGTVHGSWQCLFTKRGLGWSP